MNASSAIVKYIDQPREAARTGVSNSHFGIVMRKAYQQARRAGHTRHFSKQIRCIPALAATREQRFNRLTGQQERVKSGFNGVFWVNWRV